MCRTTLLSHLIVGLALTIGYRINAQEYFGTTCIFEGRDRIILLADVRRLDRQEIGSGDPTVTDHCICFSVFEDYFSWLRIEDLSASRPLRIKQLDSSIVITDRIVRKTWIVVPGAENTISASAFSSNQFAHGDDALQFQEIVLRMKGHENELKVFSYGPIPRFVATTQKPVTLNFIQAKSGRGWDAISIASDDAKTLKLSIDDLRMQKTGVIRIRDSDKLQLDNVKR